MKRKFTVLENGVTIISEDAPHSQSAAICVNVMAGSVHEPEGKAGLAHLLEHVVFRGATKRSLQDVTNTIEYLGGDVNARTFEDRTAFSAHVLLEDTEVAVELLTDLVCAPQLHQDDIELEKQIVADENCSGCWNCTMSEALFDCAYPGQELTSPVIGYEETVAALQREDLKAFHEKYYVGNNISVSVCAALEHEKVVEIVSGALKTVSAGEKSKKPQFTYEGGEMKRSTSSDDAGAWIAFDVTGQSTKSLRALAVFHDILGGHAQSLFMQELREKRGLVYGVWTDLETYAGRDQFRIYLQGPSNKFKEICYVAFDVLRDAASNLAQEELKKAKRRMHVGWRMGLDNLEMRADDMILDIADREERTQPLERFDAYQGLTVDEITSAASKMIQQTPTVVMSAPLRHAPKFEELTARLSANKPTVGTRVAKLLSA